MILESTSPLVLRSPVQGRPTIAWAAAYHKEAEKRECRARKKPEKAEAARGGVHVTGRIKDMMIVRGKNCFPDDIEKSLRRDLPILRGRRFVVFQNAEDLIYCFVEEAIEAGGSAGVPGLARDGDDEVGSI